METIEQRVLRGGAFLDAHFQQWFVYVNLDTLNLWDANRCVLGQLYGTFMDGAALFQEKISQHTLEKCAAHGFMVIGVSQEIRIRYTRAEYHRVIELQYDELTAAWVRYIRIRKEQFFEEAASQYGASHSAQSGEGGSPSRCVPAGVGRRD